MLIQSGYAQARDISATTPHTIRINFEKPYRAKPHINVGLVALDNEYGTPIRINTNIDQVHPDHFVLRLNTWADSKIFWARVNWTAIGTAENAMKSEDNSDVDVVEHHPYDKDDESRTFTGEKD